MNFGLLGAIGGLGQGLDQIGMMEMQRQQKLQDQQREEALWRQRQRFMENMKAPTEKQVTRDDPDNKGHKITDTQNWVPSPDDNTPGHWETVSSVHVPVKWQQKEQTFMQNGVPMVQQVMFDPDNPDNQKPVGDAIPKYDQQAHADSQARLGIERDRLNFDQNKFDQEQKDKKNGVNKPTDRYSFHQGNDPDSGEQGFYGFDKQTNTLTRLKPSSANTDPPSVITVDPTTPGSMDNKPPMQPLGQFDRARAGRTVTSSATGGGGSAGTMSPTPAKGAGVTPTGKTATNPKTGQRLQQMSDGSWQPM